MLQWCTFDQNSVIVRIKILDSSSTTGAGKTGLTSASSGLIISTIADSEATATAYTQAGSTIETITTLGTYAAPTATKCRFKEVDATNHKGVYELQFADARFSIASAKSLLISISGATGAAECDAVIPLPTVNLFSAGGILEVTVSGIGGGVIDAASFAAGAIDANALATDAVTEIAGGVWDLDATGHQTQGTFGQAIGDPVADANTIYKAVVTDAVGTNIAADIVAVQADTDNIQTRLPTSLVSGRIDASVGAIATGAIVAGSFTAGAIDASAIAADAIGSSELAASAATEIADAILSRNVSNVEATAAEHTLCTAILAMLENSISGTTLTIKRTDGSTTHYSKTLTTDPSAEPITGIT